jgi:hypothetical protein
VQRAEAGARVSAENTLALCATLEIRPEVVPSIPVPSADTLPHLEVLRSGLDKALGEYGERPLWRKADASPVLADALLRMGLPGDAAGFAEARERILRGMGRMSLAREIFEPLQFVWVLGLMAMPVVLMNLATDYSNERATIWPLIAAWAVLTIPLVLFMRRRGWAYSQLHPTSLPDIRSAGIVWDDLFPLEAALTREFLWVAEMAFGEVRVTRIRLDAIEDVKVVRTVDGFHSVTFWADGLPASCDETRSSIELKRLRDDEVRWLDRRFGTFAKALVWSPAMA